MTNFVHREPFEGQSPTEKTEVRILDDKHSVYFGVLCFDPDPNKIVARELRRDVPQELEAYFEIIINWARDRRNAYVCQLNPRGTQRDALITEEQRTDSDKVDGDPGGDGFWTSEARISVRAADVKGEESAAPEGVGLLSIAQGFAGLGISDEERLDRQFPVYDALYAYVQGKR